MEEVDCTEDIVDIGEFEDYYIHIGEVDLDLLDLVLLDLGKLEQGLHSFLVVVHISFD